MARPNNTVLDVLYKLLGGTSTVIIPIGDLDITKESLRRIPKISEVDK